MFSRNRYPRNFFERQIRGNDRGFPAHDPFIETEKKLRGYETVGKFRSQVINDQKITVIDQFLIRAGIFSGKRICSHHIKKIIG